MAALADMMNENWIVVPTYWGKSDEAIYDHPTPLDGRSTLPRLLESLSDADSIEDFTILILMSTSEDRFNNAAIGRVKEIIEPYKDRLNFGLADHSAFELIKQETSLSVYALRGYGLVRTMQLLIPGILGARNIIAIDDDEVIEADYLVKTLTLLGEEGISGLTGPYLNRDGSYLISQPDEVKNLLIDKSFFMNQAFREMYADEDPFPVAPMALGGNMAFTYELFSKVAFDPFITRGEDSDYLINARAVGIPINFSKEIPITHLPPRHYESSRYMKLMQDVIRFFHEREKLRHYGMDPHEFDPYPGPLLTDELDENALDAMKQYATLDAVLRSGPPEMMIAIAHSITEKALPLSIEFMESWPEIFQQAVSNKKLKTRLSESIMYQKRRVQY